MSQTLQSVLCITTNEYLVHVLLHARFSVVGPIPFLLAAIFFSGHPYIGSTTVLPDCIFFFQLHLGWVVLDLLTLVICLYHPHLHLDRYSTLMKQFGLDILVICKYTSNKSLF